MKYVYSFLCIFNLIVIILGAPHLGVFGGDDANIKDFPYSAGIFVDWGLGDSGYFCMGTILNEDTIVTSAICTLSGLNLNDQIITVRYGSAKFSEATSVNVTKIYTHKEYKLGLNDIGIMKVEPSFVFGENARPVALPPPNAPTPVGKVGTVTSWGETLKEINPNTLQKLNMTVTTSEVCENSWSTSLYPVDLNIQICALNEESTEKYRKADCAGDNGAALVIDGTLFGILASYHQDCGVHSLPSPFTKVSKFLDWITPKL